MALRTIRRGSACLSPANFAITSSKSKSFPKGNVEKIHADGRKQPVFNLVLLAGPWRQVTHRQRRNRIRPPTPAAPLSTAAGGTHCFHRYRRLACRYSWLPTALHQRRMLPTAKAVSWSHPTLTHP